MNAGGTAYTDTSGNVWSADLDFSGGGTSSTTAAIAGTNAPALYQSCRFGNFSYSFSVPNGSYTVTLKFAELYFTQAGSRIFNVNINGTPVLTGFDIVAQAGGPLTAVDEPFPVVVTNGQINIQFVTGAADRPLVNAIQILSGNTPAPASPPPSGGTSSVMVDAGGGPYTDPSGNTWSADFGYSGGSTSSTTAAIGGTNSPTLYQSCRFGSFSYNFSVANGSYAVTLKFAEIYFRRAGSRVFNVAINGATVLSNFDIAAEAGALTALDKTFPVTVTNGQVAIQFIQGSADLPIVSAISVAPTVPIPATTSATLPSAPAVLVNAGGGVYTDPSGNTWSADYGFSGGSTSRTAATITGSNSPTLYQSCRFGAFNYSFSVPNGSYTVTLKFADFYFTTAGSRLFNVNINGTAVLTNFDIVAQANGGLKALDKSFSVAATNGQINLQFIPGPADQPMVNAIEISAGN